MPAPATMDCSRTCPLPPLLYPRAGLALAWGCAGVPMLVSEIQHGEAAVINLESYGGHETVLCEGYGLLERPDELKGRAQQAQTVDGVLVLGAGPLLPLVLATRSRPRPRPPRKHVGNPVGRL